MVVLTIQDIIVIFTRLVISHSTIVVYLPHGNRYGRYIRERRGYKKLRSLLLARTCQLL